MILEEGVHTFECDSPNFEWASASSPALLTITVKRNEAVEDLVYITGPTHTWWSNNPLFNPPLKSGETIEITIEGPGAMRFECQGLKEI